MSRIRQPAVAGHFYPAEAVELQAWLAELPSSEPVEFYPPRMLLLPHAGYDYSGQLAALGVNQLAVNHYQRVILLCPAHRVALRGIALPAADCQAFTTPSTRTTALSLVMTSWLGTSSTCSIMFTLRPTP